MSVAKPIEGREGASKILTAEQPDAVDRAGLDLRDHHEADEVSPHDLAVARGSLEHQLSGLIFPPNANTVSEFLTEHMWAHRDNS